MANVFIITSRKSQPQESLDPRARHISQWVEASDSARKQALGENFAKDAESLYNLSDAMTPGPVYRPSLSIPRILLQKYSRPTLRVALLILVPPHGTAPP